MQIKKILYYSVFFLTRITSFLFFLSCNPINNQSDIAGPDEYYTCSMDPQVIENKEGTCPICHMKLIKVKKNNLKAGQIKLSKQQIILANITFDTLRVRILNKEITLTGKVTADQNLSEAISTSVQGRIYKLHVKNTGEYIQKGQLLYEIYSEDLIEAQQQYITALQKSKNSSGTKNVSIPFEVAAKNKLSLYDMNKNQINQLKISKKIIEYVPVYSNQEGFISEINVTEGNYVAAGSTLFRLNALNSLWVETQVYLPYLSYIKQGTESKFYIPAAGKESFTGNVIFIDPQVQSPARFVLARFKITNPSLEIKPGMLVNILLNTEKNETLSLPLDAVMQDSKGSHVWVYTNEGLFENKMVNTGMQNGSIIEIKNGLKEGEIVVVTGAYLLNSEYVFKKGANPMQNHIDMPEMKK